MSITAFFTKLKSIWQELDSFMPIPRCTCQIQCTCQLLPIVINYKERDYVIRFLRGLNEQYSAMKLQIMFMNPLPNIDAAFYMLIQQERELAPCLDEQKVISNVTNDAYDDRGRGKGKGFEGQGSGSNGKNFGSKGTRVCTFCNKTGHMVEKYYKKHGYPPHYRRGNANCAVISDDDQADDDSISMASQRSSSSSLGFTPDQHKALLNLLQNMNMEKSQCINQITTMPGPSNAPGPSYAKNSGTVVCDVSHGPKVESWILDTGATNHICHTLSKFHSYKRIKPILIKLSNGSNVITQYSGTVYFSDHLYLIDVLYVPSFRFNLISVSQMIS